MQNILEKTKHSGKLNALTQGTIHILECFYLILREFLSRLFTQFHNLGLVYNARKVNCSCVYSAYILKPVLSERNL